MLNSRPLSPAQKPPGNFCRLPLQAQLLPTDGISSPNCDEGYTSILTYEPQLQGEMLLPIKYMEKWVLPFTATAGRSLLSLQYLFVATYVPVYYCCNTSIYCNPWSSHRSFLESFPSIHVSSKSGKIFDRNSQEDILNHLKILGLTIPRKTVMLRFSPLHEYHRNSHRIKFSLWYAAWFEWLCQEKCCIYFI